MTDQAPLLEPRVDAPPNYSTNTPEQSESSQIQIIDPGKRKCTLKCGGCACALISLILIGLLCFFLWPRTPTIGVTNLEVSTLSWNDTMIDFEFAATVNLTNNNYVSSRFSFGDIKISYISKLLAVGYSNDRFSLASSSTHNGAVFNVSILDIARYSFKILSALDRDCGYPPIQGLKVKMTADIQVYIAVPGLYSHPEWISHTWTFPCVPPGSEWKDPLDPWNNDNSTHSPVDEESSFTSDESSDVSESSPEFTSSAVDDGE